MKIQQKRFWSAQIYFFNETKYGKLLPVDSIKWILAIGGSITVQIVSRLTGLDSVVSTHSNNKLFYCLVQSNPVKLETTCTSIRSKQVVISLLHQSNNATCTWCYKTFFGGNLDFTKFKKWKKFLLMSEPALKCENNAVFNQIYTLKLFIAFKMAYSCCFRLGDI